VEKTEYSEEAIRKLLQKDYQKTIKDLIAIGFLSENKKNNKIIYTIPYLYRHSMELKRGSA
jgi:delta-aminolevulinic acid dehydratase/porphobilinogen synthase